MRTSNGTHKYRSTCLENALALAASVPGPIVILPKEDDEDEPDLPPDEVATAEARDWRRRLIASATEAIDEGFCPRCKRLLPKKPTGSIITPCLCVPLCKKCRRLEQYWVAQTLYSHWLDDKREDDELLSRLDLLA
jgi:hypothetical protein